VWQWPDIGSNPVLSVAGVVKYIEEMSIDRIAAEALRLPDNEGLALALERDRQLETGEVQGLSHQEMMWRLRR